MKIKLSYITFFWAILLGCPFALFSQTETFRFYDEINEELIEEYEVVLYRSGLKTIFPARNNSFVELPRKLIQESDSIHLITNFQQIPLVKSQFDSPQIFINRSNILDEVILENKTKERFWIGDYKGKKYRLSSSTFSYGVALNLGDRLPAKLLTLEIPIKGWSVEFGTSYKAKIGIDLRLADSDFNHVGNLSVNELIYSINKKGSHNMYMDVSDYDFIIDDRATYLIVMFNHFNGRHVSYSVAKENKTDESFTVTATYNNLTKEPSYHVTNNKVKRVKAELEEL